MTPAQRCTDRPDLSWAVAIHEAAHAVTAIAQQVECRWASMDRAAVVWPTGDDAAAKIVRITMAGDVAMSMIPKVNGLRYAVRPGTTDDVKAREICTAHGFDHAAMLEQTRKLCELCWDYITVVAHWLRERGRLSGAEIEHLMRQTKDRL